MQPAFRIVYVRLSPRERAFSSEAFKLGGTLSVARELTPSRHVELDGVIFAWGETDIDDPEAGCMKGIRSASIPSTVITRSTRKYRLVPYLALSAAARVLGLRSFNAWTRPVTVDGMTSRDSEPEGRK